MEKIGPFWTEKNTVPNPEKEHMSEDQREQLLLGIKRGENVKKFKNMAFL